MSGETLESFNARAEHAFAKALREKDRELDRARRALALSRATLTDLRWRVAAAQERLEELVEQSKSEQPTRAWYVAIIATLRGRP